MHLKKILPLSPDEGVEVDPSRAEDEDDDDDYDDEFYTPKETPRDIMPELESEESAEQRRKKKGQGLKILTPQQMLSRLPIKSRK